MITLTLYIQVSSHFHSYLEFPQLHSIFPPQLCPRQNLLILYIFWGFLYVIPIRHCDQTAETLEIIDLDATYIAINPP